MLVLIFLNQNSSDFWNFEVPTLKDHIFKVLRFCFE